ncbi:unnamed protein product, partial [Candidula unifasciata]
LYSIKVPPFYTAFSGDLDFNYSIPGNMALPNSFIRLEYYSKNARDHMIITTMGLRLGFSSGSLRVACGVIEFAGNFTLRMYTRVNGDILTETSLDVRWPEVGLSLPDNHEAQTSSVELRIISRANCSSRLHRHLMQVKLLFQRTHKEERLLNLTASPVIYVANFTSINAPFTTVPLGCYLFDLDGIYQAVLVSSFTDNPLVAASNVMTVSWSKGYHIILNSQSAFPCQDSISLMYTHPPCSDVDKIRLYAYLPTSSGSPASPLESVYVTEVIANPDMSRKSFNCKLFNQSASGFCFVYVSVTRGDVVSEQAKACIPAQPDSAFPIDGSWGKWTSWTSCSVTCGTGKKSRFRTCTDPAPKHGGRFCVGDPVEWTPCEIHCPEAIPRTPLHSPSIDPACACGCTRTEDKGQIIATGRCSGLSTWLINSTEGHVIALHFDYFSLNYTRQWVRVRDGTSPADTLLFSSSTKGYPVEVVTSGPAMRVELMTTYVNPPPVSFFAKNATLPIHAHGFIASYEVRAILVSSTAPVLFQHKEQTVLSSTITIVGIVICTVVIIVAVVFVIIQRTFFRRRVKYTMTSSDDSPAHQSQNSSSSPSSPGNAIHVDMEVPLTGKTQRRGSGSKISRASSSTSIGSQKMKRLKSKGDANSSSKGGNKSPKPASKHTSVTSPYGIEIIDIDEKEKVEKNNPARIKTPRTPLLHSSINKTSPVITPISPVTKLELLNKKRQDKKVKGVVTEAERDVTGSSGSRSPSTTKAEVNWPQSTFIRAALSEVSKSLADKHKYSGQRPPSEEIPLLDSMTSSIESPSHFNNLVKSESTESATTSFVRPVTAKVRRPTSLTESYSAEAIEEPNLKIDSQSSGAAVGSMGSKLSSQTPAILPVKSVQLSPLPTTTTSFVNNKPPPTSSAASISKYPFKPSPSQISLNSDKNLNKQKITAYEERQTSLPKPDGQSPKLQERKNSMTGLNGRESASPGKASRASSKSSRNNISSPARSIATPSEIEGLELEYDDFVEDDPLSYFDYEETQKLAFRGVEKIGKTPVEEEDEDEV